MECPRGIWTYTYDKPCFIKKLLNIQTNIVTCFRSAPPSPSHITGGELSIADSLSRETSPSPPVSSSDQQPDEVCLTNTIPNQTKSPNKISHTNGVLHYVSSTGNLKKSVF